LPTAHCATYPADVGVVEVPQHDKRLQAQSLLELEEEGFVSRLPLIRQPVVDTHNQVSFVASVSHSYPYSGKHSKSKMNEDLSKLVLIRHCRPRELTYKFRL